MARNEEKAQSMLNRWLTQKEDKKKKPKERRPYLASECSHLPDAEKWRQEIIKEVIKEVAEIQNESLGEYRIRELNDSINKKLREKRHWERRIVELGGKKYQQKFQSDFNADEGGIEPPGSKGYKYFGAARKLPGVRDLFHQRPAEGVKRTRYDMHSAVDADYYGLRDDDDGVLKKVEAEAEEEMRRERKREWKGDRV